MMILLDHHVSHAANALSYTRPWKSKEDTVILTIDGHGTDYRHVGIYDHNFNLLENRITALKSVGIFYYNCITRIFGL
jgi:predicted NodU family carbamoyl transferase